MIGQSLQNVNPQGLTNSRGTLLSSKKNPQRNLTTNQAVVIKNYNRQKSPTNHQNFNTGHQSYVMTNMNTNVNTSIAYSGMGS
jgi:hypothetical protein